MRKILGAVLVAGLVGIWGVGGSYATAYELNEEAGEYAVSFAYNIYGEDGVATRTTKALRLDAEAEDIIEIGSLLTDLGMTADSPEKPTNPNSESGTYYWKFVGGEDVAVETLTVADFTGYCRITPEVTSRKCARLEAVFPDAVVAEVAPEEAVPGIMNMLDEVTGLEINFKNEMPAGAVLSVEELLANVVLKDEAPVTLKRILDIKVLNEGSELAVAENEMSISLPLTEDLAGYQYFQIVYIVDGETREVLPASVEDGKLVFQTNHLSAYGIQAANKPFSTSTEEVVEVDTSEAIIVADSPDTGAGYFEQDNTNSSKVVSLIAGAVAILGVGVAMILKKIYGKRSKF